MSKLLWESGPGETEPRTLKPGDVVQLKINASNLCFAGCMMVVTEVKPWGVQGYIQAPGDRENMGGQAYYRARTDEFIYVGKAAWTVDG